MVSVIKKIDYLANKAMEIFCVLLLVVMVVVVSAQVFLRWVHLSLYWSEEFSQYAMVWCAFVSGALCVRKGEMVGLEVASMALPPKAARILSVIVLFLQVVVLLALAIYGFQMSVTVWGNKTPILKWSMGLMYSAIPVGFVLMAFDSVMVLCQRCVKGWGEEV